MKMTKRPNLKGFGRFVLFWENFSVLPVVWSRRGFYAEYISNFMDRTKQVIERMRRTTAKRRQKEDTVRQPVERFCPDYRQGLTARQAALRTERGWANVAEDAPGLTTKEIIHQNVFTYFNLIFLVLTILLCLVGSFRNLTFLPVILFNTLIGIVQEIRAKRILDRLNMLHAPHADVVRDGRILRVDSQELVADDIVIFQAGNQVCADAEVVHGSVQVNESLLTGESDEITKTRGARLMSGSFIVSGKCAARLTEVGGDAYIAKLASEAKRMDRAEQSEMIRSLDRLVRFVGIALIPIGIILFVQSFFFNNASFRDSITAMVAAVIGMIPEGLYLLTSVALAVSSMRLAYRKVLLHDMKSIETLARVQVLCVDKTGTITENTMRVKELIPVKNYNPAKMPGLERMLGDFVRAMDNDNQTMEALKAFFKENTGKKWISRTPFTSMNKYSGVTYEDAVCVLGAPEMVLREDYKEYEAQIQDYAGKGYRVLVFGEYAGVLDGKALTEKVCPLGLVLIANPVRRKAAETFAYFAEQGVEIKVISGDNPVTVSEVAKEAGIAGADRFVDASALKTADEIRRAVGQYTVFGRVTPEQKRQFVRALKEQGKTVAMTGDGVNDVLALKDADCSVAMASGSDAAVQTAQVVLLESDFSCMPSVVLEGRRVVNNIQRSASLFLVKNIFSFFLSLFSVVLVVTYPLEPSQVSLISMFTIGVPGFFLAFQPNKDRIQGHFMTNVVLKALPAAITDVVAVGALVIFGQTFGVGEVDISTAATSLLLIVGFMILYRICLPMNLFRWLIWGDCIAGCIFCIFFLPELFAISGMSQKCVMLFVVFSIATEPVFRYLTWLVGSMRHGYRKLRRREDQD